MRENRQSGSEGGARFIPCPYPYRLDAYARFYRAPNSELGT